MKKKAAHLIDVVPEVVRFNFFRTRGFERYVGSKFTHWAISARPDLLVKDMLPKNADFQGYISYVYPHPRFMTWYADWNREMLKDIGPTFNVVGVDEVRRLSVQYGWDNPSKVWPSTGAMTLAYMLDKHKTPVGFYGFEHLKKCQKQTPHYFERKGLGTGKVHNPVQEEAFFSDCVAKGLAVRFEDHL